VLNHFGDERRRKPLRVFATNYGEQGPLNFCLWMEAFNNSGPRPAKIFPAQSTP